MSLLQYTLRNGSITVVTSDGEILNFTASDAKYKRLRSALAADVIVENEDEKLTEADFDELMHEHYTPGVGEGMPLTRLSGRISYDEASDVLLFDNDPLDTTLADYIRELCKSNHPQVNAFVRFMERLSANPSERSRKELFNFFKTLTDMGEKLTITPDGKLVAYKGVMIDGDGDPASINSGPGIVDGVHQNGHLKNRVGSVVEVSRSYVDDNELIGCSRGLHAGTYSYAHGFARGMTLRVEIDPADVVSVPQDCAFQKIRCCRYTVIEVNDEPETKPVVRGTSEGWTSTDYELWESAGYDDNEADPYVARGYTLEEAFEIEDNGGLDDLDGELDDWFELGFDIVETLKLQKAGVTLDEAATEDFDPAILSDPEYFENLKQFEDEDDEESDSEDFDEEVELKVADKVKAAKKAAKKARKARKAKKRAEQD